MHTNIRKPGSLSIAVSGASGFIGTHLVNALLEKGHQVRRLVRVRPSLNSSTEIFWNPDSNHLESQGLENIDVVVNLAGKNLATDRWTKSNKIALKESRVKGTKLLSHSLSRLKKPPYLFLSASGVGFYGNRHEEVATENTKPGSGFLAQLCREWELATWEAEAIGTRVHHLRFGMVLSPNGGALKKMLPIFRFGLGAVMGSGQQFVSWIAMVDAIAAIIFLIENPQPTGPFNIVAPNPVTNREFTKGLAQTLRRPAVFRLSDSLVRFFYGEMGEALLLESTRAVPTKLIEAGFQFKHSEILPALSELLEMKSK